MYRSILCGIGIAIGRLAGRGGGQAVDFLAFAFSDRQSIVQEARNIIATSQSNDCKHDCRLQNDFGMSLYSMLTNLS